MNREIKFRVWNGAEMVYDVTVGKFGVFYVNPENGNGLNPKDSASLTTCTTKYFDTTPVMQYTGLKGKNEAEIYEGDILYRKSTGTTGQVVFYRGKFMIKWKGEAGYVMLDSDIESAYNDDIIGNIYKNADLLNTK
jgi:uncharacterized phage protein (TIGR01671 family)